MDWYCGVKGKLFVSDFAEIELTDSRKIVKYKIWRKSVQWDPICFIRGDRPGGGGGRGDRLADMTKLIVAFRNSAIAPKRDKPVIPSFSAAIYLIFCKTILQDSQKAIGKLWTANHARELNFLC
jgi:hypothetical protein